MRVTGDRRGLNTAPADIPPRVSSRVSVESRLVSIKHFITDRLNARPLVSRTLIAILCSPYAVARQGVFRLVSRETESSDHNIMLR